MRLAVVVPVRNREALLDACLASLVRAQSKHGNTEIVSVDNESTDQSLAVAQSYAPNVRAIRSDAKRVGGVRNAGAKTCVADAFVFVDCDCVVPESFLVSIERVFTDSHADAVGCEVVSPSDGHWTEVVADKLHRPGGDGVRAYINSACFAVRSDRFVEIGGFDEQMTSSEDVDICRRIRNAGGTLFQSESLAILHLGNPKSLRGFYRRLRWHGEGALQQGRFQVSLTVLATIAHTMLFVAGVGFFLWGLTTHLPLPLIAAVLVASICLIPAAFVLARAVQLRRSVPLFGGLALMVVSFFARAHGLLRSIFGAA